MNLEYFIAKRLVSTKEYKSSISSPIIKIAIAAIAIGMVMMIVSVATGTGLQQKIRQKIAAFNGHIVISSFNGNESNGSIEPIAINQKFYPEFNSISGINHVQTVATKLGMIRTETDFEGITFKGVGKDYKWEFFKEYLVDGRVPNVTSTLNEEVIISEYISKRLKLKIGSSFNTFFFNEGDNKLPKSRRFNIVGIYNSGFQEFDALFVIGDIRHVQKLNRWSANEVGAFEVFIDNFDEIYSKGEEVYKEIPSELNSQTIVEKYLYIFDWLHLFDFNIVVIIIIMIIVSTINMVVALLVLILERTQMVGILKSLGANNWSIRKIFLYNAIYLIFRGLLWGNAIGIGLLLIQKNFEIIKLNPESYYVNAAPVEINVLPIFLLNLGTMLICFLILLIPSYIITKIEPSKTIRFD